MAVCSTSPPVDPTPWNRGVSGSGGGGGAAVTVGKTDAYLANAASGIISVWTGTPGSETDSGTNVTAYNRHGAIPSGKWVFLGQTSGGDYYVINPENSGKLLGKTDSTHNKGANGTVSIYDGTPGSASDTGSNVTAYNTFSNLAGSKWCWVEWNGDGYFLTSGECT